MCNNRMTGSSSDMKLTRRGRLREAERVIIYRNHRKQVYYQTSKGKAESANFKMDIVKAKGLEDD